MTDPVRLSKRLIEITGCSRREAELYIEGGWVRVDGVVVEEPQFKVEDQSVELLPDAVLTPVEPVTLLLNLSPVALPLGDLPGLSAERPNLTNQWSGDNSWIRPLKSHFSRLTPCIPLQEAAHGLHVLTQDWRVERRLKDDLAKLEQEYVVEVTGTLTADQLKRMNRGISKNGRPLAQCKVSWQNETRLRFAVKNPLPGQILFMCNHFDLDVVAMKRIRIGAVPLSKLPPGQWRYLAAKEHF